MSNHSRKFLTKKNILLWTFIKPIRILPLKKIHEQDIVVQTLMVLEGSSEITIHEPKQLTLPLIYGGGLEDTFMVQFDHDQRAATSSSSTPTCPPGFEPSAIEVMDAVSSSCTEDTHKAIIPKRMISECKRLCVTTATIDTSLPKSRRSSVKVRAAKVSQ